MSQYAIVTDLNRCVGCMACMVACKAVNNVQIGNFWNKVLRVGPTKKADYVHTNDVEMYYLPACSRSAASRRQNTPAAGRSCRADGHAGTACHSLSWDAARAGRS